MGYEYEAMLDPSLASSFRARFSQVVEEKGFVRVLELAPAEGPRLVGFRRGQNLLALAISPGEGGKERLRIESESLDFTYLVIEAASALAAEFLEAFLGLVEGMGDSKLKERLTRCFLEVKGLSDLP